MSASQDVIGTPIHPLDTSDSQVVKLRFTLLRASSLPGYRIGLSKYFVTLKTSAGWTDRTDQRKGKNPEWNQEFLCDVKATSATLSIDLFHVSLTGNAKLVAIAFPDVSMCLHPPSTDILDKLCPLLSPTDHTPLGEATIYYSCSLHHDGRPSLELMSHALQKGEDVISKMTITGDSCLATAVAFASSEVTYNIINILGKIDQLGQIITDVHPYAKLAWTVLNAAQRAVADQIDREDRIRSLWETVKTTLDLVDPLGKLKDAPLYKKTVEAILKQIYECALFLRWYAGKGHLARDTLSDKANSAIEIFEKAIQDLPNSLQNGTSVDHIMQTYRLVAATECIAEIAVDVHLDRLPGAALSSVEYDKQKACLPGTRKELLNVIEEWIHTPGDISERILWLSGPAGTGKSSVANSIAERMDSLGRLAASFRFDRGQADRTPAVLIGNLCRQVARFDNSLGGVMLEAVKRHGPGGSMPCASQAAKLFVCPISTIEIVGPIVIVIDALDESGNDEPVQVGTSREDLVRTIVEEFIHLPPSVKVIITSREEGCITTFMSTSGFCKHLLITETSVGDDIGAFIETEIRHSRMSKPDWPGHENVQALTQYANGLFIWAAVACNFIKKGHDPDSQMKKILDPSRPLTTLDALYMTVVEQSLKDMQSNEEDGLEMSNWHRVVGTIVAVRTPLTVIEMDALLGLPTDSLHTTRDFVDSLLPLLEVDAEQRSEVQLLHKSVFDFLTTQTTIPIDIAVQHQALAVDCLAYMNKNLSYEMSWIEPTSPPPESCNASALRYACRHFSDHLSSTLDPASCAYQLGTFLRKHLLHFFEVMARLKEICKAEESLKLLLRSLTISSAKQDEDGEDDKIDELLNIIRDGISFLQTSRGVCLLSPMDVYHSGIATSPKESWIYKLYSSCVQLPRVTPSSFLWSRSLCVFQGHKGSVTSVAFPQDGRIVSESWDSTLRLWGAEKGEAIGSLEGHRDGVTSIVFSPGASGSWDNNDFTRTDCMKDMIVRFSGRKIPEGLSPAKRRKFIDSILNDPNVRHRFVFRQWPLIPSPPTTSKQERSLPLKGPPNGIKWWGSTLFDFFSVQPIAGPENESSFTTGNRLLNGEYGVNAQAKDCIAWAEKEKDPELIPVYNIANLIKELENAAHSYKADEEESRMQEDTGLDTGKKHDETLTLPQPWSLKSAFDSAAYPEPWSEVVPFRKSGPWRYDTLPVLEEYIPQSRLPQKLVVHDPWNLISATDKRYSHGGTSWNEQVRANPDCVHTYTLSLSDKPAHTERRKADEKDLGRKEGDQKSLLDNFLANPHSLTPRPFGLEIRKSYADLFNVPTKPAIYVILPPRPPLEAASEAHLYLSPRHYAGAGNHSFVYHAEWELPRSCLVGEQICIRCVMEDVEAIIREQDGETGKTRDNKWDQLTGKIVLKVVNTPPITVMMTNDGGPDAKEYVLREGENSREVVYEGPYRVVHSRVKYQNLARAPYCEHLRKLTSSIHPLTTKVRVIAKLSIRYDYHLHREAKNYQQFPKHLFAHWSGYNLLPPIHGPIPIGPVVPQFYGYYTPKEVKSGHYLSPILLLEDCGEPIVPESLSFDDRQECASLGLRLHMNRLVHGSFYQRNIVRKPGPLSIHPDKRVKNTRKRGGYGVDWSYRLIDFGRGAYVDEKAGYKEAKLQYDEHMNIRSWAAGKKELG